MSSTTIILRDPRGVLSINDADDDLVDPFEPPTKHRRPFELFEYQEARDIAFHARIKGWLRRRGVIQD